MMYQQNRQRDNEYFLLYARPIIMTKIKLPIKRACTAKTLWQIIERKQLKSKNFFTILCVSRQTMI